MPGTPQPVGRAGDVPPLWVAVLQQLQTLQQQVAAVSAGAQQTNISDAYGNTIIVLGLLNQQVTIGASFGQAGVQVTTAQTGAGLVVQQGLRTTTVTTTAGSTSATVASTTGLSTGMTIGAANVKDPSSGIATPAIVPGTTISNIVGTTVTLSAAAAETGSALFCAACSWKPHSQF